MNTATLIAAEPRRESVRQAARTLHGLREEHDVIKAFLALLRMENDQPPDFALWDLENLEDYLANSEHYVLTLPRRILCDD